MMYALLITFLINFNLYAEDKDSKLNQIKDELIESIPKVRNIASKFELVPDKMIQENEEICVECEDILKLTNEINKIVSFFPNTTESKQLSLERGNLEALIVVTTHAQLKSRKNSCVKNEKVTSEFSDFNESQLELIFTDKTLENFKSMQVSDGATKTIWLRGKNNDQDKFIKVEIKQDGSKYISFYSLKIPTKNRIKVLKHNNEIPNLGSKYKEPTLKEKSSGELGAALSLSDVDLDLYSYKAKIGPSVSYEYFIPNKITYLDISGSVDVTDSIAIKANLEASSDKNEAQVQFGTKNNKTYSSINVNDRGDYNVKAQYTHDFEDDYSLSSSVAYISDGVIEYTAKANSGTSSIVSASYKRVKDKSQTYTIGKEYKFDPLTTISIKYEKKKDDGAPKAESNYWLTFSRKY